MIVDRVIRKAAHSGTWYSDSESKLRSDIQGWLGKVPQATEEGVQLPIPTSNAVIVPHAGYFYSGSTAAYAYKSIATENFERVFILGPNHHYPQKDCSLTSCNVYETPLGPLNIDTAMNEELKETGEFSTMEKHDDEDEHSIELQLPYLRHIFNDRIDQVKFVPILVGNLSVQNENKYGELLAPYLADKSNLFIISTDFCHWGDRFNYNFYSTDSQPNSNPLFTGKVDPQVPIYRAIENLDLEACRILAHCKSEPFQQYLENTENTICGRHPIAVLLRAIETNFPTLSRSEAPESNPKIHLLHYKQSSQVERTNDSSVSYVAAYLHNPNL